jgi:hypothetical protein
MSPATPRSEYDLFVSYAHADDRGENVEKVAALVQAIKDDYQRVIGSPLQVFFDTHAIRSMDDWEARILTGLRQSKMMVAVLSPAYFASDYCRREWELYVETELAQALPGEGITPIYVVRHPSFEADGADVRAEIEGFDLQKIHSRLRGIGGGEFSLEVGRLFADFEPIEKGVGRLEPDREPLRDFFFFGALLHFHLVISGNHFGAAAAQLRDFADAFGGGALAFDQKFSVQLVQPDEAHLGFFEI